MLTAVTVSDWRKDVYKRQGYCDHIEVTINKDNSSTVVDNGRGIPVGIQAKAHKPAVEVVFTILHAGGKFGGGGYKMCIRDRNRIVTTLRKRMTP